MHICHLNTPIEYYSPISGGAVSTVVMQQAKHLTGRGHSVTVFSIVNKDEIYSAGKVIPIRAGNRETLNFWQRRISGLNKKLARWDWPYYEHYLASCLTGLKQLTPTPDVVITHNDLVMPSYLRRALPGAKILAWLHNEQYTDRQHVDASKQAVDRFVAVSDFIRTWTVKAHGIPEDRIATILNGADLEAFYPREDYLQEPASLRVLFLGRIDPNKGPDIVADAVATLQKEGVPICLTVAGNLWFYGSGKEMQNPFFRELMTKVRMSGANYLGHVVRQKVPELIRAHDVVCLLARSNDPCPLVTFEALASGAAIVAANRGGLPEACGGAGILVDPDDFGVVVDTLRLLATDPILLRSQKIRSIERATEVSWALSVDNLERIIKV